MEAAAVRLYFLLEHNYSLVTMSGYDVNSCTNFSKDNIARELCTLVPFMLYSKHIITRYTHAQMPRAESIIFC